MNVHVISFKICVGNIYQKMYMQWQLCNIHVSPQGSCISGLIMNVHVVSLSGHVYQD